MIIELKDSEFTQENLLQKSQPLELKADATSVEDMFPDRMIKGYGSVFDVEDCYGDTILHGAFTETLKQEFATGFVKFLYAHDTKRPIGRPLVMKEDDKGLWGERIVSCVPDGDAALQLAYDKVMDGLSIGFWIRKSKLIDADGNELDETASWWDRLMAKRHIIKLKLAEDSIVTWGANPSAKIDEVRSMREYSRSVSKGLSEDGFFDARFEELLLEVKALKKTMDMMLKGVDPQMALTKAHQTTQAQPEVVKSIQEDDEVLKNARHEIKGIFDRFNEQTT
jgi:HK97 family phage prohead protease